MSKTKQSCRVEIFSLDLDDDDSGVALARDHQLTAVELHRADQFVFPIHRQRYVRGRTWLRQILSDVSAVPAERIELVELEFGKPAWRDSALQFNLSHAENNAVLALSDSSHVGIDVESYDRELDFNGLRKTLFTDLENDWLDGLPAQHLRKGFFILWTAKEARMKVTGEGFYLPAKEIEVQCNGHQAIRYLKPAQTDVWLTELPDIGVNLCCTLATTQPVNEVIRHK